MNAQQRTYLAPTRASDLANVVPAFLAVGSVDFFLDEDCDYALRLSRAGVPVELHVYRGVFHAFDLIPGTVTDRFVADLNHAIQEFLTEDRLERHQHVSFPDGSRIRLLSTWRGRCRFAFHLPLAVSPLSRVCSEHDTKQAGSRC